MDIEDSYVVRIYRRTLPGVQARDHAPSLTGIVEIPATGQRRAFHDIEELWTVLADFRAGRPTKAGGARRVTDP